MAEIEQHSIAAAETAIGLRSVAPEPGKRGDNGLDKQPRTVDVANSGLFREAHCCS